MKELTDYKAWHFQMSKLMVLTKNRIPLYYRSFQQEKYDTISSLLKSIFMGSRYSLTQIVTDEDFYLLDTQWVNQYSPNWKNFTLQYTKAISPRNFLEDIFFKFTDDDLSKVVSNRLYDLPQFKLFCYKLMLKMTDPNTNLEQRKELLTEVLKFIPEGIHTDLDFNNILRGVVLARFSQEFIKLALINESDPEVVNYYNNELALLKEDVQKRLDTVISAKKLMDNTLPYISLLDGTSSGYTTFKERIKPFLKPYHTQHKKRKMWEVKKITTVSSSTFEDIVGEDGITPMKLQTTSTTEMHDIDETEISTISVRYNEVTRERVVNKSSKSSQIVAKDGITTTLLTEEEYNALPDKVKNGDSIETILEPDMRETYKEKEDGSITIFPEFNQYVKINDIIGSEVNIDPLSIIFLL